MHSGKKVLSVITLLLIFVPFSINAESPSTNPNEILNANDNTPPLPPSHLSASEITKNSFTVDWRGSRDVESDIKLYNIYLNNLLRSATQSTYKTLLGLSPGVYIVEVSAVNGADLESQKSPALKVVLTGTSVEFRSTQAISFSLDSKKLSLHLAASEMILFRLFDTKGRRYYEHSFFGESGKTEHALPQGIPAGFYLAELSVSGQKVTGTFRFQK